MINNKKIVILNGTNEEDILCFVDCAFKASENIVYHSILDAVKHIAHLAQVGYPSDDSGRNQKLIDELVDAFDTFSDLSFTRFKEILSGFYMLDDLDHLFIYTKYPDLEKKFVNYAHEMKYNIQTLFIESNKEKTCLSDVSSFDRIISNNGSTEDLMDATIKYICTNA